MNNDERATGLYPSHAKFASTVPAAAEEPADLTLGGMYPSHAPQPVAPMYSAAKDYEGSLRDGLDTLSGITGFDAVDRATYLSEAAGFFREAGIPPAEAGSLHDVIVAGLREPASQEQIRLWNESLPRELKYNLGAKDYEERLTLVRDYLGRRTFLRDVLGNTGMGSHPKVVRALLMAAHSLPRK